MNGSCVAMEQQFQASLVPFDGRPVAESWPLHTVDIWWRMRHPSPLTSFSLLSHVNALYLLKRPYFLS